MKPPYHRKFVKDCGYCEDLGEACKRLRNKPWAEKKRVGVGFWPGLKEGEPDHWYIFWINNEQPYLSSPKEPTEAEVRAAVEAINAMPEPEKQAR